MLLLDEPTSGLDPLMEQQFRRCVHEATERGQTIFLSSHILSEVEELCARVGILRAGELVEVSSVDTLRQMHASQLEIDVDGEPPDLAGVAGVESVEADAERPAGAAHRIARAGAGRARGSPRSPALRSQEASLEEIFLAYYGDDATTPASRR